MHAEGEAEFSREEKLAELLKRICEEDQSVASAPDVEGKLDELSDEELAQLIGAGHCLNLLDRIRDIPSEALMPIGKQISIDQSSFDRPLARDLETIKNEASSTPRSKDFIDPNKNYASERCTILPDRIGRFEIVRLAAKGGFAHVYLAHDAELDRDVALKVPFTGLLQSERAKTRFQREARSVAILSHPAIVPIYESGSDADQMFIAFEWIPGSTLYSFLAEQTSPVPVDEAARAIERIAEAVGHAHRRGVLHRDLKPANILVDDTNSSALAWFERLKITDFGLAKNIADQEIIDTITVDGSIIGTPAYMSPEQVRSEKNVGSASDVFSCGILLYELLAGKTPHKKDSYSATLRSIETEPPVSISKLRDGVKGDLAAVVHKCLEKAPADRYEDAFELAADLERLRNGLPVRASHPTAADRIVKWFRREPLAGACLILTFLSLVGGLVATTVSANRANQMAIAANQSQEDLANQLENMKSIFEGLDDRRSGFSMDEPSLREKLTDRLVESSQAVLDSSEREPMRSSLLTALGGALSSLGQFNDAATILSDAIELAERNSTNPGETALLQLKVEHAYAIQGQLKNKQVIEGLDKIIPSVLSSTEVNGFTKTEAVLIRAESNFLLGNYTEAVAGYRQLIELISSLDLDEDRGKMLIAIAKYRTARVNYLQSPGEMALDDFMNAFEKFRANLEPNHPRVLTATYEVIATLNSLSKSDEALVLAESSFAAAKKKYGMANIKTLTALDSILTTCGQNYSDEKFADRLKEVLPMIEQACNTVTEDLGESHPNAIVFYGNLAIGYGIIGKVGHGIAVKRKLVALAAREHGRKSSVALGQIFSLGVALKDAGETGQAVELFSEFVAASESGVLLNPTNVANAKKELELLKK